ncbi:exosortase F system-associated membrane protein [Flavobacterium sp. RHBU_24]|uniref:exosortase F system-associated membrane protein n=1 Tax=Flavobacterium sp. RHBU_24 TaxID=3391185 RepID=UPI00398562EB
MAKKLQLSAVQWVGIVVLALLLISVRLFEHALFYDPFIKAFHNVAVTIPDYETGRLFLHYFFRYALNTSISLSIMWLFFKDTGMLRLAGILYVVFFIVLMVALYITLQMEAPPLKAIFYLRRFLIQPMFILLFLPAFYYQKYVAEKN